MLIQLELQINVLSPDHIDDLGRAQNISDALGISQSTISGNLRFALGLNCPQKISDALIFLSDYLGFALRFALRNYLGSPQIDYLRSTQKIISEIRFISYLHITV